MNLSVIKHAITSKTGRTILLTQKHSPTILFAGGVIGVVATTVMASRATLKVDEVLKENRTKMADVKALRASNHPDYSESDYRHDLTVLYTRKAIELTKLYGPTVIVGVVSIAALTQSHRILSSRNAALTAAYAAVEKGFREYRARVVNELGEEKDKEFRFGSKDRVVAVDTPKGVKKETIKTYGKGGSSIYARLFNNTNINWQQTPEYNFLFLRAQQNYANQRLVAQGHLLLNDVYEALGFPRTKEGCVVGWIWDPEGNINGDNEVDFGVFDGNSFDRVYDFVRGEEGEILLDFNVDEKPIYNLI